MRFSKTGAKEVIHELQKCSMSDLDRFFNEKNVPNFDEIEGETAGAILSFNPKNPLWLQLLIRITLKSPLGQWSGKKFITPFGRDKKGYGTNLFKNKIPPDLFKFDTYIKDAYVDGEACLSFDYRRHGLSFFGLVDDVRRIRDGLLLGKAYLKFPWKSQMWFVGYFVLVPCIKEKCDSDSKYVL